ncbi:hypothetical protein OCAR_4516 [Afipia carboxidovorans OM5]|nr:hypothetical protein OCAR_4516 [Afipia carboxidovorans OM5]
MSTGFGVFADITEHPQESADKFNLLNRSCVVQDTIYFE